MDDYLREQLAKWGEIARAVLRGELINFRRDGARLRFSQPVIDSVAKLGEEQLTEIQALAATLGANEILLDLTMRSGPPLSAVVVPRRLLISLERVRVEARLPGGFRIDSERALATALIGMFNGVLGVGDVVISSLPGAYLQGEEFSYQFPTDRFVLVRQLQQAGNFPDIDHELPMRIDDGWLEIELRTLADNALIDIGALLKGFKLRRFLQARREEAGRE